MQDRRIGKHGESEPQVCAVTGQICRGQHATHYSIGNGYYIAILEKEHKRMNAKDIMAVIEDCKKVVKTQAHPAVVVSKKNEQEKE